MEQLACTEQALLSQARHLIFLSRAKRETRARRERREGEERDTSVEHTSVEHKTGRKKKSIIFFSFSHARVSCLIVSRGGNFRQVVLDNSKVVRDPLERNKQCARNPNL